MGLEPLQAMLVQSMLAVAAAVLAKRAKPIAIVFGIIGFVMVPWSAGPVALLRGLSALTGFVNLLRIVDVVRFGDRWSSVRRVLHVVSFVDSRTLRRAPRHVDLAAIGRGLLWAALAGAGLWAIHAPHHLARLAAGLVLVYAAIESAYAFFEAVYRAIGFVTPPLHVLPLASLSIGELWGTRWARPISTWLRETCFRPLARRGYPVLGIALGFAVSAIGHAVPTLVALDVTMAAMMFAFFLVQGVFVLAEAKLGVARWSRPARRAWTVTWMVASSPLFVSPVLRAMLG